MLQVRKSRTRHALGATLDSTFLSLVNGLFTTFGKRCGRRSSVTNLYRIVHGLFEARARARKTAFLRRRAGASSRRYLRGRLVLSSQTANGLSMNTKRSYLDTLNAGRQRRVHASLEELNRSVGSLGHRLDAQMDGGLAAQPARRAPATSPGSRASQWAQTDMSFDMAAFEQPARRPAARADESNSQSLAREIEKLRRQDEGLASAGKIAAELKGLRDELRQQMTTGLRREFESVRKDIQRAASARPANSPEFGVEFDRLSDAVRALSERGEDRGTSMLRLELEQMRAAIDNLAREETVRAVGNRWDDFDRRWSNLEEKIARSQPSSDDPALDALASRLEQINQAVNSLPESLSLRSLEEKVRLLAGAIDHFARKQDDHGTGMLGLIEDRLDEISRAIVASAAAAQTPQFDTEPFERVEARITSLARQIEELVEDRPTQALFGHMESLARRVDEIAERGKIPEKILERFAAQITDIAERLDAGQSAPDAELILRGIEQRFDTLSDVLDRRQGDAFEQSQSLFRDLERRLDDVAARLDARPEPKTADTSAIMLTIDQRFADLARQVEERAVRAPGGDSIRQIEMRLDDISARLDTAAGSVGSMDSGIVNRLEDQVAELTRHLSRPGAADFEEIAPRLDEIEKSIATSRESVITAAREAAEAAVRGIAASEANAASSGVISQDLSALTQDLKSLESLARRSDDRNTKTFEAIHETLLKIVERLTVLEQPAPATVRRVIEDAPAMATGDRFDAVDDMHRADRATRRTPAEAAAAAAVAAMGDDTQQQDDEQGGRVRSVLGGLTRAFAGRKERVEPVLAGDTMSEPRIEPVAGSLDQPLDPKIANQPLEPGSGAPDLGAIVRKVREERAQSPQNDAEAAKSDFIAAARRAAQAAAAEAGIAKRGSDAGGKAGSIGLGEILRKRRKPILMGTLAILVALAGMQLGKAFFRDDAPAVEVAAKPEVPAETAAVGSNATAMAEPAPEEPIAEESAVRVVGAPEEGPVRAAPAEAAAPAEVATLGETVESEPVQPAAAAPAPVEAGPVTLREAADSGDPKAMFEIGSRYAEGRGVKADMAEAAKWYERSAQMGFAPAQYRIGNFNEKGIGVARDVAKAKTWYQMAAEQGNASAMHNLAVLFAMGVDGTTDNESAGRWFVRAADLGVKDSQFNLGILSAKGVGVEQSLEESYKWFALVAKTGDKDAAAKRDEVANALRPDQLTKARASVELWKPQPLVVEANTVDIPDSWRESGGTTAAVDMKKAVQNIQAILNKNGYDAGNPDGVMGQRTKNAIAAFQRENGMEPTGEVDEKLVRALLEKK